MACLRPHSQDRVELGFEPRPSDKERAFASCLGVCVATHSGSGSSPRNPPRPGEGAPSQGQPHPVTVALGTASILSTPGTGERNAGPAQPCSALLSPTGQDPQPSVLRHPCSGKHQRTPDPSLHPEAELGVGHCSWAKIPASQQVEGPTAPSIRTSLVSNSSQRLGSIPLPSSPEHEPPSAAPPQKPLEAQAGPHWVQGPSTTAPGGGVAAQLTGHRHLSWRPPPPGGQALHILVPAFFTPLGHSRFSSLPQ